MDKNIGKFPVFTNGKLSLGMRWRAQILICRIAFEIKMISDVKSLTLTILKKFLNFRATFILKTP